MLTITGVHHLSDSHHAGVHNDVEGSAQIFVGFGLAKLQICFFKPIGTRGTCILVYPRPHDAPLPC